MASASAPTTGGTSLRLLSADNSFLAPACFFISQKQSLPTKFGKFSKKLLLMVEKSVFKRL
jgi:hypothetical protein